MAKSFQYNFKDIQEIANSLQGINIDDISFSENLKLFLELQKAELSHNVAHDKIIYFLRNELKLGGEQNDIEEQLIKKMSRLSPNSDDFKNLSQQIINNNSTHKTILTKLFNEYTKRNNEYKQVYGKAIDRVETLIENKQNSLRKPGDPFIERAYAFMQSEGPQGYKEYDIAFASRRQYETLLFADKEYYQIQNIVDNFGYINKTALQATSLLDINAVKNLDKANMSPALQGYYKMFNQESDDGFSQMYRFQEIAYEHSSNTYISRKGDKRFIPPSRIGEAAMRSVVNPNQPFSVNMGENSPGYKEGDWYALWKNTRIEFSGKARDLSSDMYSNLLPLNQTKQLLYSFSDRNVCQQAYSPLTEDKIGQTIEEHPIEMLAGIPEVQEQISRLFNELGAIQGDTEVEGYDEIIENLFSYE